MTKGTLTQLVLDHCMPGPGQGLTAISLRMPYDTQTRLFYVPSDLLEQARANSAASQASAKGDNTAKMPTTSAVVAPGSMESAMARAVIRRSYTKTAARPSSLRPLRSMMLKRASNASVVSLVLMCALVIAKAQDYKTGGAA